MAYSITGLDPAPFAHLVGLTDEELAVHHAVRMTADAPTGYPCRVTLEDAAPGETLLLVNHVSHEPETPYRATHAIFVGEGAREAARFIDELPSALENRILSIRAFDRKGMMIDAALAQPGETEATFRRLFVDPAIDHLDAHNATRGCFAARVERG